MGSRNARMRGAQFLLAQQGGDGLWRDFLTPAGEASEWPTGFIATALHGAEVGDHALARAAEALVGSQRQDGGWGYNEIVPSDADSTACVLLFLALAGYRGANCVRAAEFLIGHQRGDSGGISTYREAGPIRTFTGLGWWIPFRGWCSAHTEVTATAGRALAALAPEHAGARDAAWRYVRSHQSADGSWSGYWWTSHHYATAQAVELALTAGDEQRVGRAAEWALRTQNADGGWSLPGAGSSAFATALCLSVLVNAGADREPVLRATRHLILLQHEDGGWPSHPIMRLPVPGDRNPDRTRGWPVGRQRGGVVIRDQHRTFTSATCVASLSRVAGATA